MLASEGCVRFTAHAGEEARQLGVSLADVLFALAHAGRCEWQPAGGTWKVKAPDPFGVSLVVIVDLQKDVVVVTVFD